MKRATLILFALVTLVSSAEAIEVMNGEEFDVFCKTIMVVYIEGFDYSGGRSGDMYKYGVYIQSGSLGVIFAKEDGDRKGWISICLVYVYIVLTPVESMGLILLIITLLIIVLVILDKSKKTKQNEEE